MFLLKHQNCLLLKGMISTHSNRLEAQSLQIIPLLGLNSFEVDPKENKNIIINLSQLYDKV